MSPKAIILIIIVLGVLGGALMWNGRHGDASPSSQATTTPEIVTQPEKPVPVDSETTVILRLGETATLQGISLTPQKPVSDSRCARGVTCIWAGTVSVKVNLQGPNGDSTETAVLGEEITTETKSITLLEVSPYPVKDEVLDASEYRFTFEVKQR
jgi:hypothetical protein